MTETPHTSPFDVIRRVRDDGTEYWSARDLAKILGYDRCENFRRYVIPRTQKACENSGHPTLDHIRGTTKMIKAGRGAQRSVEDFELSRFACYLVVENADPDKPIVALGQQYFAVQTRRQELETDQVKTKDRANVTHHQVGKIVRKAIAEAGGTMPEDLPTPEKSIQELQREEQKQIEQRRHPSLFDEPGDETS